MEGCPWLLVIWNSFAGTQSSNRLLSSRREEMQLLCCRLYKDVFYWELTCTLTIGQHTIVWLGCGPCVQFCTGMHTWEVESAWSQLKLGRNRREGLQREDLQSYLDEKMWRQWRDGSHDVIMHNFLAIFPLQCPAHTPVFWFFLRFRQQHDFLYTRTFHPISNHIGFCFSSIKA